MINDHFDCNCFDCLDSDTMNNVDTVRENAADYIGGKLRSLTHNVNIYSSPTGVKIKTVPAGKNIGTIFSWVKDKSGNVWFMMENENKGFVKLVPKIFDTKFLNDSLDLASAVKKAEINKKVQERLSENKNPLYQAGKGLLSFDLSKFKFIIYIAVAAIVLGLFLRFKG